MNLMTRLKPTPPPVLSERVAAVIAGVPKSDALLRAEQVLNSARDRRAALVAQRAQVHLDI